MVVNASPLVFLGNAGRMDLLRAIGAVRVIVPHAVLAEVTATQHTDLAARSVAEAGWIERAAPSPALDGELDPAAAGALARLVDVAAGALLHPLVAERPRELGTRWAGGDLRRESLY